MARTGCRPTETPPRASLGGMRTLSTALVALVGLLLPVTPSRGPVGCGPGFASYRALNGDGV